jgi:hypothetical protein
LAKIAARSLIGATNGKGETMTIDDLFSGNCFKTVQKLSEGGLKSLADLIHLLGFRHGFAEDTTGWMTRR